MADDKGKTDTKPSQKNEKAPLKENVNNDGMSEYSSYNEDIVVYTNNIMDDDTVMREKPTPDKKSDS